MLIDEYLVKLGVVGDMGKAKEYREGLVAIGDTATKVIGIVTGAIGALGAYFASAVGDLDDLGDMAKNTGTSVAFIQEFGYAASQTGSSVEAARESVKGLARMVGEAANGVGKGAKLFDKFGISVKNADGTVRDMGDIIAQIQNKMSTMSAQQQGSFLAKMGIDASMRQVLGLTSDEFQKLIDQAREWGVNTEEQADQASVIDNRFKDLKFGMQQFRTMIGLSLIPVMDRMIGKFKEWFREDRNLIQNGLMKLFSVMGDVIQVLSNAGGFINKVISGTIGWKNAILLLAAAWAIWNAAILANPLTYVVIALAAILLLVDDLMTYLEGGESLFGEFWDPFVEGALEAWSAISSWLDGIGPVFQEFMSAAGELVATFRPVVEFFGIIFKDTLVTAFQLVGDTFKLALQLMTDAMKIFTALAKGDFSGLATAIMDTFQHLFDWLDSIMNRLADLITNTLGRAAAFFKTIFSGGTEDAAVLAARNAVGGAQASAMPAALGGAGAAGALPGTPGVVQGTPYPYRHPQVTGGAESGYGFNTGPNAPGAGALAGFGVAPERNVTNTNSGNVNQTVTVNVQSTDPAAAGREAADAIQRSARTATANAKPTVTQ